MKIRKVLFATDFSERSEAALPHALWYAREFEAELHVVHVLPEMSFPDPYFAEAAQLRAMAKAAQERVPEEADVDHVVLSSHGRTGIERVLLGSVAEGVVRRASCPVLTVKSFGRDLLAG